jgi:hypothetical protein
MDAHRVLVVGLDGYPETIAFKRAEHRALEFAELLSPRGREALQ